MSFRDDLAKVIAGNSRHSIEAYAFVLESLQLARSRKLREIARARKEALEKQPNASEETKGAPAGPEKSKSEGPSPMQAVGHVSGQEFCESARRLALRQFGFLARMVLDSWGIRSTSDMGEIVYSLIASGHLEKTPQDRREDFDDVYDFATAFRPTLASIIRDSRDHNAGMRPGKQK
ncbi:MAG: hypothetical protein ABS79_03565 [Planctomycetes bacterium SCN 63-9]|nr:MAG: hypothetical protein ABS79_03565 [Planctomycetes bacterium SCN 63-9]